MQFQTANGAPTYEHSMDHLLEYFSKGGSITQQKYYISSNSPIELFKQAWFTGQHELCMKLAFWTRDPRGGAGSRKTFRDIIAWLANISPDWINANIHRIPEHGRWDDLKALYDTPCEYAALTLWSVALLADNPNVTPLAAKWADRQDWRLRNFMKLSPKAFRKLVSRKSGDIVEKKLCARRWDEIEFSKVPSVASIRYKSAFERNAKVMYEQWKADVVTGKEKVNTSVLFPHDFVRLALKDIYNETYNLAGDDYFEFMEKTFQSLPNYIPEGIKMMPVCDFSGSMEVKVSGSIRAIDVSLALGLYCSEMLGEDNPFYRKLIPFSTDSKLVTWKDMNVVEAIREIPDGYVGSTNIKGALDNLLDAAVMFNVKKEDMITTILILSDMQFNASSECTQPEDWYCCSPVSNYSPTIVEQCMQKWEEAGYNRPRIVYWNLNAYEGSPSTKGTKNVSMISGFSPSILEHALANKDITPEMIMMDALDKYTVEIPSQA